MLKILYQDSDFVAVNKPSGLLVHPLERGGSPRELTCMHLLKRELGKWVYPLHRLDRPTAGVVLFATSSEAASSLGHHFRNNEIVKNYQALVRGYTDDKVEIDYPLAEEGKAHVPALTRFETVARTEIEVSVGKYASARYSLLKIEPETGRFHQIRKHLAHISHPIVGDTWYGDGAHNRFFRERFGAQRLFLWSTGIEFKHPYKDERIRVEAKTPPEVEVVLRELKLFDGSANLVNTPLN